MHDLAGAPQRGHTATADTALAATTGAAATAGAAATVGAAATQASSAASVGTAATEAPSAASTGTAATATPSAAPSAARPAVGTAVATHHFTLLEEHARGGMGQIMVGTDSSFERRVAVKLLLADHPDLRARFEREARITASLQHPGIVPVYAAGEHEGRPFYVMRLVGGKTLARCLADAGDLEGRLALLPQVLAVVETIAYAHQHRVLHRDLKPQNVMIGEFGEAVVLDWGLGKIIGEPDDPSIAAIVSSYDAGLTEVGSTMGTPAYMPVEQARGDAVDATADVYALGAILYELFEGRPPYVGRTTAEVIAGVLDGPPPPLGRDRAIAPELATIVTRAMAREAKDRYPNAGAVAEDLRRYLRGQLVGAHRYTKRQLFVRWLRRHRSVASVVVLAVIALGVTIGISMRSLIDERDRTEAQRVIAEHRRSAGEKLILFAVNDLTDRMHEIGRLDALEGLSKEVVSYYELTGDWVDDWQAALHRIQALGALASLASKRARRDEELAMIESALEIADRWRVASVGAQTPLDVRERALAIERERVFLLADRSTARSLANLFVEARRDAHEAIAAARAMLVWELTASERESASSGLIMALHALLQLLENENDHRALRPVIDELLRLGEAELAAKPDSELARRRLALALYKAAATAFALGDLDAARGYNARGLPIQEALARTRGALYDRTTHFGFLQIESRLAADADREPILRRALAIVEEAHGVDRENVAIATMYLHAATDLAATLTERTQLRDALDVLDRMQALDDDLSRRAAGDARYQRSAAKYQSQRATALFPLGRPDDAVRALRRCVELLAAWTTDRSSPDAMATGCEAQLAWMLGPASKEAQGLVVRVRAVLASPALSDDRGWIEAALAAFPE